MALSGIQNRTTRIVGHLLPAAVHFIVIRDRLLPGRQPPPAGNWILSVTRQKYNSPAAGKQARPQKGYPTERAYFRQSSSIPHLHRTQREAGNTACHIAYTTTISRPTVLPIESSAWWLNLPDHALLIRMVSIVSAALRSGYRDWRVKGVFWSAMVPLCVEGGRWGSCAAR